MILKESREDEKWLPVIHERGVVVFYYQQQIILETGLLPFFFKTGLMPYVAHQKILETGLPFIAHNRCQLSLYDLPYALSTTDPFKSGVAGLINQGCGPDII